jgi:hypothetical protein
MSKHDLDRLRHRIRFLELLCEEYKTKAKRLALEAAHYARLCKQGEKGVGHE